MNLRRSFPYCVLVVMIGIQSSAQAELTLDNERLKQLAQSCVEAQIAAGNTNVFSPDRSVDDYTLVFAGVSYLPDGLEIDVSLDTESNIIVDGPWGICSFRKENDAIAAVTYSLGGKHWEKRIYIPSPLEEMSESEIDAYLTRRDWIRAKFDLRNLK
jgi:hypothetical protein